MNNRLHLPTSQKGKYAFWLGLFALVSVLIKLVRIPFPFPALLSFVIAIVSLVLALVAFFKDKDKSLWLLLPIIFGALATVWLVLELAFPH